MAIQQGMKSDTENKALLTALLAERGITRYGLFAVSGEGKVTPDGYEETSGYALSHEDRVFFFWTGWDETMERTVFSMWVPTGRQVEWLDDAEYQSARVAAGLT